MTTTNTATTMEEPSRRISLLGEWDLAVAGAGLSGISAAISAARLGMHVCILDKQFGPGGLATLGNVTMWLPLCNGKGTQVTAGLAEELLKLSVADITRHMPTQSALERFSQAGITPIPQGWQPGGTQEQRCKHRYQVDFNPSSYLLALEEMLLVHHVDILYDTRVCAVLQNPQNSALLDGLIIESKSGRQAIKAKAFVDATGDADIAHFAGEETVVSNANVPAAWAYTWGKSGLKRRLFSNAYSPLASQEGYTGPFFRGDDVQEITAQVIASRSMMREKLAELQNKNSDPSLQLFLPPAIADFRMTRRIQGRHVLKNAHQHQWLEDAVGFVGDWRKAGPVYPISFGSICCKKTENLLVVGRSLSADYDVWDAFRVFPPCAVTGEAAGTASALRITEGNRDTGNISIKKLQLQLIEQGVLLDPQLLQM